VLRETPQVVAAMCGAVALAVIAQHLIAADRIPVGLGLYLPALLLIVVAAGRDCPVAEPSPLREPERLLAPRMRLSLGAAALLLGGLTFALSGGNRFQPGNVLAWLLSISLFWIAYSDWSWPQRWWARLTAPPIRRRLLIGGLLVLILLIGGVFRFWLLFDNPRDMNSDQAEKLLDVHDILNGTYPIFFERNTGREPWQFYWTAGLIRLFDLAPDFMALKIGTALIGWLMLPAVFLLAREVFGSRTALLATLFAAMTSWGVITARYGLRYPLAPCAVAWTLALLVRGLHRGSRNALLGAGLWMGIGLQGYTAYRAMPLVLPFIVLAWASWETWRGRAAYARRVLASAGAALLLALLVLVPLLRYGVDQPEMLFYRVATRVTGIERAIDGNPLVILIDNIRRVLLMFNYTSDVVWVANIPGRPALDAWLGALLPIGVAGALVTAWRRRQILPLLLVAAALLLILPSALSIAFPGENPSVVRTGGALPVIMLLCALIPGMLLDSAARLAAQWQRLLVTLAVLVLIVPIIGANYERVFVTYPEQYCSRAQNASDIAQEMQAWAARGQDLRRAWVIGYPHWVDTRAVGVWVGDIAFANTVMGAEALARTPIAEPAWFALNRYDLPALRVLQERFPQGYSRIVPGSLCDGREFVVFETAP
jgi:4-amino-4-deoxy-L-arabinose transferase-like glycosyltransferase